ncbi:MAG: putative toxin-antitoxin system toxin component, PIN family [Candidatus Omnitrophica bacterium]|nr:putative toxin-antitoxin system toxin component, PIN family [Candidatus Omnitrophota bacterium]
MRVVLDTNVLVSGIFFHGTPGKIIDAWLNEVFAIFASPSILDEYARVLLELGHDKKETFVFEWMDILIGLCHMVPDSSKSVSYSRDPHDDKFIDCAIGAKANYLITGDKDLIETGGKVPFKILTPAQFLHIL